MRIFKYLLFLVFICPGYLAADGVLEINQTCALNGGCFSGDSADFPVTINGSAGRSYRLTGDLDLSAHPTFPAISITDSFVTLDLNGFQIAGATECEPGDLGFDLECDPSNTGAHGIELVGEVESVSIRNGTIRKMPDEGINGADSLLTHVENVAFSENAGWGALLGDKSLIQGSRAQSNGGGGFSVQDDSNISQSLAFGNDGVGFDAGDHAVVESSNGGGPFLRRVFVLGAHSKYKNNTANAQFESQQPRCGGGTCTDLKRFFVTESGYRGDEVLNACPEGFHMAAMTELQDLGGWVYDDVLGYQNLNDLEPGAPTSGIGRIRTTSNSSGQFNCFAWTSESGNDDGISAQLIGSPSGWSGTPTRVSAWTTFIEDCSIPVRVWCAED